MVASPATTAPFGRLERFLARRYLAGRRREGFISVIAGFSLVGIALGVATLIVVMSVMNGFRSQLVERILGVNPHVAVFPAEGQFENAPELAAQIAELDGVRRVAPVLERQVLASHQGRTAGALVRGIRAEDLASLPAVAQPEFATGSVDSFRANGGLALGEGLATRLGVGSGGVVTLLWPDGDRTPLGTVPRVRKYPVTYVFKIGMSTFDRSLAYLSLTDAEQFFGTITPDHLEVMVEVPDRADEYPVRISALDVEHVRQTNWKSSNASYLSALAVERNVMFLILTLIIGVAALNIISGMIMLVKDKASSIAILRTMGASTGAVMRVFFLCGASIGFSGTVIGVVLGVIFCLNIESLQGLVSSLAGTDVFNPEIYFLSQLPAELQFPDVIGIAAMGFGLSILATLYPAWRAARIDPVESLRHV